MMVRRLALALLFMPAFALTAVQAAQPTVDVTSIVDHPALNAVRDGLKEGLAKAGYEDGREIKIVFQTAQGQPAVAAQIARQFAGSNPAVIVAISTPSAQAVVAATKTIPVVFSAVTDPVGAHLVQSLDKPNGNVTGSADFPPIADELGLLVEIIPSAKRVGVVYNPGEANSVSSVRLLQQEAGKRGLTVVEAPATRSADVRSAALSLSGRADAIFVPTDNTVASAFQALAEGAQAARLPLISANTDQVALGAVAALGFNYKDVGEETAGIVARILKGAKPADIPIASPKGSDLFVNKAAAQKLGLALPESVLRRATRIVD